MLSSGVDFTQRTQRSNGAKASTEILFCVSVFWSLGGSKYLTAKTLSSEVTQRKYAIANPYVLALRKFHATNATEQRRKEVEPRRHEDTKGHEDFVQKMLMVYLFLYLCVVVS